MLGERLARALAGCSGPLFGVFCLRAAALLREADANGTVDAVAWARAFQVGAQAIAALGGASPGDCTVLDALLPAVDVFASTHCAKSAADAAESGAEATVAMRVGKGRGAYLGERAVGHMDPGAAAIVSIVRTIAMTMNVDV